MAPCDKLIAFHKCAKAAVVAVVAVVAVDGKSMSIEERERSQVGDIG